MTQRRLEKILYTGVTRSILIGYEHAANSCLLCFYYVIPTGNRFYICRIGIIPTDNSFMHAEVTSPNTLTSREEERKLCQSQKHSLICLSFKEMDDSVLLSLQVQLSNSAAPRARSTIVKKIW